MTKMTHDIDDRQARVKLNQPVTDSFYIHRLLYTTLPLQLFCRAIIFDANSCFVTPRTVEFVCRDDVWTLDNCGNAVNSSFDFSEIANNTDVSCLLILTTFD